MNSKYNRPVSGTRKLAICKKQPPIFAPPGSYQPPTLRAFVQFDKVGPPGATQEVSFFLDPIPLTGVNHYFASKTEGSWQCDLDVFYNWTTGALSLGAWLYSAGLMIASIGAAAETVPPQLPLDKTVYAWPMKLPPTQTGRCHVWA